MRHHTGPMKDYRTNRDKIRHLKRTQEKQWDPDEPAAEDDETNPRRYNRCAIEPEYFFSETTYHTGVWAEQGAGNQLMWSDTAAEVYESPGDVKYKRRSDQSNLYAHVHKRHECHAAMGRERREDRREQMREKRREHALRQRGARPRSAHY